MESNIYQKSTNVTTISDGIHTKVFSNSELINPNDGSVPALSVNGFHIPDGEVNVPSNGRTDPNGSAHDLSSEFKVPDGGWGWVVAFASFMNNFLLDGMIYTFGIYFDDFLRHFGGSKAKTQSLGSVITGQYLLIGPLVGAIESRFESRRVAMAGSVIASLGMFLSTFSPNLDVMILLYGIVGGTGFGLVYIPSVLIVSNYFNKRRAFATGIAVCGSGTGGLVLAPLGVLLLDEYGWQGAMWILSGIVLNGVVFATVYRPIPSQHMRRCYEPTCSFLRQTFGISLLSSPSVVVYLASCWLVSAGFFIPFNFLPAFAKEMGLSASEGAFLISIIGVFNTLLRVVIGVVSDRSWADCILTNGVGMVVGGVATLFISYCTTFATLAVYSAVFGSVIGIYAALKSIILIELKGISRLTEAFGLQCFCIGIAALIGSPLAGFLSDMTGNFVIVFYFSGTMMALGGSLCLPLRRILQWEVIKQNLRHPRNSTATIDTYM